MTQVSAGDVDPLFVGYVVVFGMSALVCFVSLFRTEAVEKPDTRRGLRWLLVTTGGWAAAHTAYLLLPGPGLKLASYYVGLVLGFAAVGPWLYFCSAYTGRSLHRDRRLRRLAVAVFLGVLAVKLTNPVHGLYFTAELAAEPFGHLAVEHGLLHWLAMGLAYALAAVGYFVLAELFAQVGSDSRPLLVLLGLTALPLLLDVVSLVVAWVPEMTYEPIGVAAFAVGTLFLFTERFQLVQLAGDVDDPVVFLDEDGAVRDANPAAVSMFPELEVAVGSPLEQVWQTGEASVEDGRVVERERDGETRYYLLSRNPFAFGEARAGEVLLITDVTRAERYRRELERQNERLGQFAGVVSHDLRNPLNVAIGRLELERERRDSDNLASVADALDRMDQLIADVLTLARRGEDVGETERVSLADVARSAWESVDAERGELHVEDVTIEADETRLQQLLENLFRNSTEHAGDAVTVRVGALEDGFYVEDDGPGFPPEKRETLFEFDDSADDRSLGLMIVGTIAGAHGWTVEATGAESGGARVEIRGVSKREV